MNQGSDSESRVLEALAKVPAFSRLDDRSRRKLAKLCTLKRFEAGDVLYEEGAMGLSLFIVTSGLVERFTGDGDERVGLGTVAAGGVLGQLALMDDQPRASSAAALEPTDCLLLTRDAFDTLVKKEPEIAWCLTPGLAGRVRELTDRAVQAERARDEEAKAAADTASEPASGEGSGKADETQAAAGDEEDEEDEEHETSDMESAFFKMMRMQFGMMAGAAKCMTETSRAMEAFLDSMADETEFKSKEDWRDLMGKIPDAMVTATREAMDRCEKIPEEMVDAYRRYSDGDDSA